MATHILVVDQPEFWSGKLPEGVVVASRQYLTGLPQKGKNNDGRGVRVINMCRGYRYLSTGYYTSLLAEARGHRVIPSVRTIQDLSRKSIYGLETEDLDTLLQKRMAKIAAGVTVTAFELYIHFGHSRMAPLEGLARQVFETFPVPCLKVEFKFQGKWRIASIKPQAPALMPEEELPHFLEALRGYMVSRWQPRRASQPHRYDLAILRDPQEKMPPSDEVALKRFIKAGKGLGIEVDLIDKSDYARLAEYDALFIRETTAIDHHTYRFAKKAQSEEMVVMDDPDSILKCTNKVFLAELLAANKVPTPRTLIVHKHNLDRIEDSIPYPVVLKIPDGAFSRGVFKAENRSELAEITTRLFKESDLILAQEYLYTPFDWRVGVLNRRPIFVSKYKMSRGHWQIYEHGPGGQAKSGGFETIAVEDAPAEVVRVALAAANLIGDGLYGVDLKQSERGVVVIEVNDNPSIDSGVEDVVAKESLYKGIMAEFLRRLELRHGR